jgi:sulfur transfer protein SufE
VSFGRQPKFPDKRMSVEQARQQLRQLLASARTLDHMTPEYLARTHRVPERECEAMLNAAIDKRRREALNPEIGG